MVLHNQNEDMSSKIVSKRPSLQSKFIFVITYSIIFMQDEWEKKLCFFSNYKFSDLNAKSIRDETNWSMVRLQLVHFSPHSIRRTANYRSWTFYFLNWMQELLENLQNWLLKSLQTFKFASFPASHAPYTPFTIN